MRAVDGRTGVEGSGVEKVSLKTYYRIRILRILGKGCDKNRSAVVMVTSDQYCRRLKGALNYFTEEIMCS